MNPTMMMSMVSSLLTAISALSRNPNTGVDLGYVGDLLDLAARLLAQGTSAVNELQAFTFEVKAMVESGRKPTDEDRKNLKGRSDDAHAKLQALKDDDAPGLPSGSSER